MYALFIVVCVFIHGLNGPRSRVDLIDADNPSQYLSSSCSRLTTVCLPWSSQKLFWPSNAITVSSAFNFPEEEEKVLKFWREIDAFKTSLKLSEGRPIYSFYDGPPFATGLPHYGHLLAGTIKVRSVSLDGTLLFSLIGG